MSAVIYAAIVVMWAVVLVPMWLRRHDATTETRSVDRFSTAMRTLSRRTSGTPGRRYVVMPRRAERGPTVHVSGAAAAVSSSSSTSAVRPARRGRASIVARRRRALLALAGLTLLTLLLAVVGAVSWLLQLVLDVALIAFAAHLRAQARRAAAIVRQRRGVGSPARSAPAARPAAAAAAAWAARLARVAAPAPVAQPAAAEVAPAAAAAAASAEAFPADQAFPGEEAFPGDEAFPDDGAETWEPVPVPRPTYTMKPPAPAFEADPTYSPPVYEPSTQPAEPAAPAARAGDGAAGDSDLDEILERRWAVND